MLICSTELIIFSIQHQWMLSGIVCRCLRDGSFWSRGRSSLRIRRHACRCGSRYALTEASDCCLQKVQCHSDHLLFSSHWSLRMSGRCFTEKSENTALKPSPSGQPCVSHHCPVLSIVGVEDLHCIETAHSLDPDVRNGLVEGNHAPV